MSSGPIGGPASLDGVRRPTLIMIVVLFVLLATAAIAQFVIASGESPTLVGPTSPGELPSGSEAP
jgi:hypothetical protein